jgi:Lrp/AsnC family leucine-responsive transcriptional regulator
MSEIDTIDRKILYELQQNARLSNSELADRVGLSTTPCWRRVKRLEEQGVISGYVALVDPKKVGLHDSVIAQVTLEKHQDVELDKFVEQIVRIPEVLEAYLVAGEGDYWLRVAVRGSADYEQFLTGRLLRIPGVSHVKSVYILKQVKYTTEIPITDK